MNTALPAEIRFVGNGATLHDLPALAEHVAQAWRELADATPGP